MQWRHNGIGLTVTALLVAGCASSDDTARLVPNASPIAQPYAGLTARPIKALAPERTEELLAGRGAGYALAAELNHYPGPRHVLDLRAELGLSADQERAVQETFDAMEREAQALGRQLVDAETALDQAFRAGTLTPADLAHRTTEIGTLDGRLRAVHLAAHLRTKAILTAAQVTRYDHLRGYAAADGQPAPADHTPTDHHRHHGR